jgi:hypothetical protein
MQVTDAMGATTTMTRVTTQTIPRKLAIMRRALFFILLVLTMAGLAAPASASYGVTGGLIYRDEATDVIKTDYVNVGGAALRLKKTGAGAFVPEYTHFDAQGSAVAAITPTPSTSFAVSSPRSTSASEISSTRLPMEPSPKLRSSRRRCGKPKLSALISCA